MKIHAAIAEAVNTVAIRECEIREPAAGEILIKTAYSCISPGTELRCQAGNEPNAGAFPMITGYSLAGVVVKGSGEFAEGDKVFAGGTDVAPDGVSNAWGGHVSYAICSAAAATKLPANADLKKASALAMASIATHGVCKTAPLPGDRVLVVGQGLIGQLATGLYAAAGCEVAVCDPLAARLEVSAQMGAAKTCTPADLPDGKIREDFPDGFDILCDASGSPTVVAANLPLLREKSWENLYQPSPKLLLLASYHGEIKIDYQQTLFSKETEVVSSRNYLPDDLIRSARLVCSGRLDVGPLLTYEVSAARADEAFATLRDSPQSCLTAVLNWSDVT